MSGEKPGSNKENNNVPNADKSRRGSNASIRERSNSKEDKRSRSKDKAAAKNKRSSSKDSKGASNAASRESTASNGRAINKGYWSGSYFVFQHSKNCLYSLEIILKQPDFRHTSIF